jgi:hypothetical protein
LAKLTACGNWSNAAGGQPFVINRSAPYSRRKKHAKLRYGIKDEQVPRCAAICSTGRLNGVQALGVLPSPARCGSRRFGDAES